MSDQHRLDVFPAFHKISDREVLVVGDGAEAAAKIRLLCETKAAIHVVSREPDRSLAALIIQHDLRHSARPFRAADVVGAALVFAASGDRCADAVVVEAARERRVPVNAVDIPELCDFYTPALINRAPVAVAISSSGAGPVLAQRLRARIEALLPVRLGDLAALGGRYREAVENTLPPGAPRRRFWRRFFGGPVADAVLSGDVRDGQRQVIRLLESETFTVSGSGYVSLVGAGPGAEDLLTLRAQRLLQEADVIVHDRLVPEAVVAMGRRDAERIDVGKTKGCHSKGQDEINAILVSQARAGRRVVRLKGGDPLVFGRLGEEMAALRDADIRFEIVPGVTAAFAAAAHAEIPLTLRHVASNLVFATGHDVDGETLPSWAGLALSGATVAVYMGRTVAARVARRLTDAGLASTTPVAVIEHAARREQRTFAGELCELERFSGRTDVSGPTIILIGEAVGAGQLNDAEPLVGNARIAA